jgi:hypothetical protein
MVKARSYLLQIEARGFFQKDRAILDALSDRFVAKGHMVLDAAIDETSKPALGHPGNLRLLTQRTYPNNYDFSVLAGETQAWLAESFAPARTTIGETRFTVAVKSLELRFDVDFDDTSEAPEPPEEEFKDAPRRLRSEDPMREACRVYRGK